MKRWRLVAGMLALVPAFGARVDAQRVDYAATLSAARGSFVFAEPTTSWVFTQGLSLDADRWRLGADLPVIWQNSSAITFIGGMPLPTGGPNSDAVRYRTGRGTVPTQGHGAGGGSGGSGLTGGGHMGGAAVVDSGYVEATGAFAAHLGDPVLHAAADLPLGASGAARLGGTVLAKIPLADPSTGVGSGEFDWGAGLSFAYVAARGFFYADVAHWVLGDMPEFPLNDLTSGSAGVGVAFGALRQLSLLASLSGATAIVETVEPPLSAGLSLGLRPRERRFFTLGLNVGLSESSPDWTLTMGYRVSRLADGPR